MPAKSTVPLRKHTLNLYEGDVERLQELYGDYSKIIRRLIRLHLQKVEARAHKLGRSTAIVEEIQL